MEWINAILSAHVPDAIWAALIAAAVAITSTQLANWHSRKMMRMQLRDGSLQRDRDRAMSLRRDVYLPAAEAIVRIQAALGQLVDLKADQNKIARRMSADLATLAKVHLVATEPTVRALMAYQKVVMPAFLEIVAERSPLIVHRLGVEDHQKYVDRADAEVERIVQLMRQHNISGSGDQAAFERLTAQSTIEQNTRKHHLDKQSTLRRALLLGQLALTERMAELAVNTAELIPDALICSRQELELPVSDPDAYRSIYSEQQQAARQTMLEAVRVARKMLEDIHTPGNAST
jgi:signal transduction histidine kinase